jgi:hypothetical protein
MLMKMDPISMSRIKIVFVFRDVYTKYIYDAIEMLEFYKIYNTI